MVKHFCDLCKGKIELPPNATTTKYTLPFIVGGRDSVRDDIELCLFCYQEISKTVHQRLKVGEV